jgi:hypothetical protein
MHFLNRLSTRLLANYCAGLLLLAGVPSLSGAPQEGPTITSSLSETGTIGHNFSYFISSHPSASAYGAVGLPPDLSFNSGTGYIGGTLNTVGTFDVTLTAQTSSGDATATLRITIGPPDFHGSFPTNVKIGDAFDYHFGASVPATRYSATGLPPGVVLDTSTGQISGVAEISGSYFVTLTAHTSYGDATGQFNLLVAPRITPETPVTSLPFLPGTPGPVMVADPRRPRVYIWTYSALVVVDTESLEVVKTIQMSQPVGDLSLSGDGNKLWIAYAWLSFSDSPYIGSIDLETLTVLPDMAFDFKPLQVREGLEGRLYVVDSKYSVRQVDSATGVSQPPFAAGVWDSYLEISPDRRTLYTADDLVAAPGGGTRLRRFDVSGSSPVLLQEVNISGREIRALAISHNGEHLGVATSSGGLAVLAASDLSKVYGNIPGATSGPLAFSADDTQLFQTNDNTAQISVFNPANGQLRRTINLEGTANGSGMLVDAANSYLFFAGWRLAGGSNLLQVYDVGAPAKSSPPKTLLNVSTRMRTQAGNDALIGGFIIQGAEAKRIVLRALGPTLPLNGRLADPVLQLYDSAGVLAAENDNWNAHRAEVLGTRIPPADEREAALAVTLEPGSYTAVVRSATAASGVALVEVYDLSATSNSKLANISTRGKVEAGDNVMIGGFIIGGVDESATLVVRAIGPSLINAGLDGTLTDPTLEVRDGNGCLLAQDDDWRMFQEAELINTGLAPTDDRESAMLLSLQPGAYTAIVRGKNNSTGIGLVEVYNLEGN